MRDLPLPTFPIADLSAPVAPRRSLRPSTSNEACDEALDVVWARDEEDVRQAQRLRHLVFAGEMGASLTVPAGAPASIRSASTCWCARAARTARRAR
jgi:putative hemolysin